MHGVAYPSDANPPLEGGRRVCQVKKVGREGTGPSLEAQ